MSSRANVNCASRIELTKRERAILNAFATGEESPPALRMRAKAILACADDKTNLSIGVELGITNLTIGRWRRQFRLNRLEGFALERRGRSAKELVLDRAERMALESWSNAERLPRKLITRARVILACASGHRNTEIARQTGISHATVGNLRKLFIRRGVEGLMPGRPGRKPSQQAGSGH